MSSSASRRFDGMLKIAVHPETPLPEAQAALRGAGLVARTKNIVRGERRLQAATGLVDLRVRLDGETLTPEQTEEIAHAIATESAKLLTIARDEFSIERNSDGSYGRRRPS